MWDRCLGFKDPTFDLSPCTVSGGNQLLSLGNPVTSLTSRLHLAQQRHPKKQWGPKTISTEFGICWCSETPHRFCLSVLSMALPYMIFRGACPTKLMSNLWQDWQTGVCFRGLSSSCSDPKWHAIHVINNSTNRFVYTLLPVNQVATHLNLSWFAWIFFFEVLESSHVHPSPRN